MPEPHLNDPERRFLRYKKWSNIFMGAAYVGGTGLVLMIIIGAIIGRYFYPVALVGASFMALCFAAGFASIYCSVMGARLTISLPDSTERKQ